MPPTTFIKAFMLTYSLQIIYKIYKVPIVKNSHTNTEWVCVRRGPRHRVSSQYLKEALCGRRRDCCTVRVVSNVSYQAVCERFINQSSPDNSTVTARNTQSSSSSLPVMQHGLLFQTPHVHLPCFWQSILNTQKRLSSPPWRGLLVA